MGSMTRIPVAPPVAVPVERVDPAGSFERFYSSSWTTAVRIGVMLTGSAEAAEEIAQDAFIGVHERWGHLDNPAAYLRVAVGNGAKNHLRKRALRRTRGWGRDVPTELEANEFVGCLASAAGPPTHRPGGASPSRSAGSGSCPRRWVKASPQGKHARQSQPRDSA
jgi:hypothetical protein